MSGINTKLQVLFLSYDGMTDQLGQSQVLPYLAGLSRKGYRIGIISFEKKDAYKHSCNEIAQWCAKHDLIWIPMMYTKSPPILSTLYDLFRLRRRVKRLLGDHPIQLLHCRSYITALVGLFMKRKKGLPFLFDMRGFWADERVEGKLWNLRSPLFKAIYKYFKKKEISFLTESACVVALTYGAKKEIEEKILHNKLAAPIEVIPCCTDTDLFNPSTITKEDITAQKKSLRIEDGSNVLSYIGSLGTWYMPKEMLRFFQRWLNKFPNTIFLLITPGAPERIYKLAEEVGVPKEKIRVVKAKRQDMPRLISCSNLSLFFIKPLFSKMASSPTKQGEVMSLGIPVICNGDVGDTEEIVRRFQSGVVIHRFDDEAYDEAIKELSERNFDAASIRQGALDYFDLKQGVQRYHHIYQTILYR